ncbi:MAG: hypothetical protein JWR19_3949 [Pedosphaera sp.]|nr:hypothetical protein [Pedosphaera sp.]
MKLRNRLLLLLLTSTLIVGSASASERYFAYSYEPETMPKGGWEVEQWATLRLGRNQAVGQDDYQKWELRHSVEYGVTDNYTVELYVNENIESFRDPAAGTSTSSFTFDGISIENRYLVLNPAEHPVGLTLYVEPRFSGVETEVEEKIILGQRHGDWKWALNLTHATEWTRHFRATEGEVEASFGIARDLNKHWAVGLELRDHNELPDYHQWENTALYIGPVVSYRRANWWGTLAVLPQVYGANFTGNPDNNPHLELEGHERWNIRLIFGVAF